MQANDPTAAIIGMDDQEVDELLALLVTEEIQIIRPPRRRFEVRLALLVHLVCPHPREAERGSGEAIGAREATHQGKRIEPDHRRKLAETHVFRRASCKEVVRSR